MRSNVPADRILPLRDLQPRPEGAFVLYWMVGQRRLAWNFALDRAVDWARHLGLPLLVFEPLNADYPWVSERHHRFCVDGMSDNAGTALSAPIAYYAYLEPSPGAGRGLLHALGSSAAVVVTDDMPHFFYPSMLRRAADRIDARVEAVDSHGVLPIRRADRGFGTAHSFRIHLHGALYEEWPSFPEADPFAGGLPSPRVLEGDGSALREIRRRWPAVSPDLLGGGRDRAACPVESSVGPVRLRGGSEAGRDVWRSFLEGRLERYARLRNDPDEDVGSGLSPYLHWGHLSTHEVVSTLLEKEEWTPLRIRPEEKGRRAGWWGGTESTEAFLDQLLTWRELGFNEWVRRGSSAESFDTLPAWAIETLEAHSADPRPHVYSLDQFDVAETHDPLWNAAQRELRERGVIHNYLRMLWGKKILEWSPHPREALAVMLELNNRYAIDGRDPNSTSGIMWVLGRYDRGWPERAIYGKVRSMSSRSTRRKVSVDRYISTFSGQPELL